MKTRAQKAINKLIELQLAKHEAQVKKSRLHRHQGKPNKFGVESNSIRPSSGWPPNFSKS